MFRKFALFFTIIAACFTSHAQSIRGTVQDSLSKQLLEDATISLVHLPDNTVTRRLRSGKREFVFSNLAAGPYRIITTYLGYSPDTLALTLNNADTTVKRVHIYLHHSASALMQVVV
ncbi:MAG TPA: carboxypeptidase regulatory-like domain-containing protein, partial [Puia sp.]|nr:carboxypeptidase regulatory-like domain-containing protein [Puia sp.]